MPLDVKKFREQQESRNERKNYIKLKPGENYIRFLPHTLKYFTEEVTEVAYSYYIHLDSYASCRLVRALRLAFPHN